MKDIDEIPARLQPGGGFAGLLELGSQSELEAGVFVGRHLGNYKLTRFLGQGGMSQIFLERFLREQQVLANLNHDNIFRL